MWKTISSKEIFNHERIDLIEDEVELPNGKRIKYLRFKDRKGVEAVTMIARNKEGKFLLEKEYSHPIGKKLWQFPGGWSKPGESMKKAVNREFAEEAGLKARNVKLLGFYLLNHRRTKVRIYVFLGGNFVESGLMRDDTEEGMETFWLNEEEVDELIKKDEYIQAEVLGAWMFYKLKKGDL